MRPRRPRFGHSSGLGNGQPLKALYDIFETGGAHSVRKTSDAESSRPRRSVRQHFGKEVPSFRRVRLSICPWQGFLGPGVFLVARWKPRAHTCSCPAVAAAHPSLFLTRLAFVPALDRVLKVSAVSGKLLGLKETTLVSQSRSSRFFEASSAWRRCAFPKSRAWSSRRQSFSEGPWPLLRFAGAAALQGAGRDLRCIQTLLRHSGIHP